MSQLDSEWKLRWTNPPPPLPHPPLYHSTARSINPLLLPLQHSHIHHILHSYPRSRQRFNDSSYQLHSVRSHGETPPLLTSSPRMRARRAPIKLHHADTEQPTDSVRLVDFLLSTLCYMYNRPKPSIINLTRSHCTSGTERRAARAARSGRAPSVSGAGAAGAGRSVGVL
ncbi:hypothetical protein EVAR_24190_1 [Eumeta japonica]|uniref:Uncharacterized protein n=1 Tax=Eumeta variegata TaxID=151549 RepID=A0A4C1W7C4_EUMVA|nr:hypothetical protein EVAR_24190_1 [Eumeta japonica]